jgi:hypothetical protein
VVQWLLHSLAKTLDSIPSTEINSVIQDPWKAAKMPQAEVPAVGQPGKRMHKETLCLG